MRTEPLDSLGLETPTSPPECVTFTLPLSLGQILGYYTCLVITDQELCDCSFQQTWAGRFQPPYTVQMIYIAQEDSGMSLAPDFNAPPYHYIAGMFDIWRITRGRR